MCKLFALRFKDNFASQTTGPEDVADALSNTPVGALLPMLPVITVDTITSAIKRVKSSYTPGPDGIPAVILKWCASALAPSLMKIVKESLRCGTFPATWISSWMTPIYKKGCKNDAVNYRGITSLSVCAKVFEMLIYEPLLASACNYIIVNQHGFVTTKILEFVSKCHKYIDTGLQLDAIYTDIKAAFDSVSHSNLVRGAPGTLYNDDC